MLTTCYDIKVESLKLLIIYL